MTRPPRGPLNPTATDDSTDAWDTIEWLTRHVAESNRRVGMIGSSYDGWTVVMALLEPHPALKVAAPESPMIDGWMGDDWFHYRAFRQEPRPLRRADQQGGQGRERAPPRRGRLPGLPRRRIRGRLGRQRRVGVVVPSFIMAAPIAAASDLMAMLPTRCVPETDDLVALDPPLPAGGFPLHIAWHRRSDSDIAIQHVCGLIGETFAPTNIVPAAFAHSRRR